VELPEGMAAEQGEEDRERGRRSASLVRSASFSGLEY
jgi:hypothetical protein